MNKLKRVLGILVFWSIGLVLLYNVSIFLRPVNDDFGRKIVCGFYGEEEDTLDIVGIGGSALRYYMNLPVMWDEFELTSYNMSTMSQSCFMVEHIIDEIKKTQSPQLYIVEIRKFLTTESKDEQSDRFCYVIDNMKHSKNRLDLIHYMTDSLEERIPYYFDIISYHDTWEDVTYENFAYLDNEEKQPLKGWRNKRTQRVIEEPIIYPTEELEKEAISEVSEEALRSLLQKCQEENLQVLFLATPWQIDETSQKRSLYIKELIEDAGFQFLDCNQFMEDIDLVWTTDMLDDKHVNMLGSEKVTRFVGQYIKDNYELSTEHSEAVVADWTQVMEEHHIQAEEVRRKILNKKEN